MPNPSLLKCDQISSSSFHHWTALVSVKVFLFTILSLTALFYKCNILLYFHLIKGPQSILCLLSPNTACLSVEQPSYTPQPLTLSLSCFFFHSCFSPSLPHWQFSQNHVFFHFLYTSPPLHQRKCGYYVDTNGSAVLFLFYGTSSLDSCSKLLYCKYIGGGT